MIWNVAVRTFDEHALGLSWVAEDYLSRAAHALCVDGKVWFVDPFESDDAIERGAALGDVAGVVQLYFDHDRGLMVSVMWHFLGFAIGTFEIYLVVRFLGVPISLPEAFAIGAYGTAVKFFSFMVPASIGALEGGNVAIFAAFDMGAYEFDLIGTAEFRVRAAQDDLGALVVKKDRPTDPLVHLL